MITSFYFVRHGEVHNPKGVWYGRLPGFGLSEKGKKEIAQTAKFLQERNIDEIYSSRQLRAKQSAEIINSFLKLPQIRLSSNLQEINSSSFEGQSFAEIRAINYDVFASESNKIKGETIGEILGRMKRFIAVTATKYEEQAIVAVSHGDPIMLLEAWVDGLPIVNDSIRPGHEKYIKHGEVYLLEYEHTKALRCKKVFSPQI